MADNPLASLPDRSTVWRRNGRFDELATIIQHIARSELEIVSHARNIDWRIKEAGDMAIKDE